MKPHFTIITPTLQRESLLKTCESVSAQAYLSWEHLVMIDCADLSPAILSGIRHPQRTLIQCAHPHRNYGNSCRHNAWMHAQGEYLMYLDDDNFLSDNRILEDIATALIADWGLFPILRHGQQFFTDPPRCCHADTANIVVKREIGRWPNIPDYTADGIWIDALVKDHPAYQAFPGFRPIVIMEKSSEGK